MEAGGCRRHRLMLGEVPYDHPSPECKNHIFCRILIVEEGMLHMEANAYSV